MKNIKLYNGDCMDVMDRMIKDGIKVDTILTSPPYNTGVRKEYYSNVIKNGKRVYSKEKRYDKYTDTKTNEQYIEWTKKLFDSFDKILKPNGTILYNLSYGNENASLLWLVIADVIKETNFSVSDCIVLYGKNLQHYRTQRVKTKQPDCVSLCLYLLETKNN